MSAALGAEVAATGIIPFYKWCMSAIKSSTCVLSLQTSWSHTLSISLFDVRYISRGNFRHGCNSGLWGVTSIWRCKNARMICYCLHRKQKCVNI